MTVNIQNADVSTIKKDRMRYKTNKLSSNLALLAVVVNVLYFASIYISDIYFKVKSNHYYTYKIGMSVLYNLIFMLAAFLSSIGVKNYKISYSIVLIVIGAMQVVRIFYLPMNAFNTMIDEEHKVMETGQFIRVLIYLIGSAALLIAAGVIGIIRTKILEKYKRQIGVEQPA